MDQIISYESHDMTDIGITRIWYRPRPHMIRSIRIAAEMPVATPFNPRRFELCDFWFDWQLSENVERSQFRTSSGTPSSRLTISSDSFLIFAPDCKSWIANFTLRYWLMSNLVDHENFSETFWNEFWFRRLENNVVRKYSW